MGSKQRLIGILIFIAAFAFAYFITWEQVKSSYGDYTLLEEARREEQDLDWLIDNQTQLKKKLQDFTVANAPLFDAFREKFSEGDVIVAAYTIAKNSGLELTELDIKKPTDKGMVETKVTIAGRVDGLYEFLKKLEKSLPFFDFQAVNFSGDNSKLQDFAIDMKTYVISATDVSVPATYKELREKINNALEMKADVLKDDRMKQFKPAGPLPVLPPTKDSVGGRDPFAPL